MARAGAVPTFQVTGDPARDDGGFLMPPARFAALVATVIAAGGATVALAVWAGFPLVALGLLVLVLSLAPGLRRWW